MELYLYSSYTTYWHGKGKGYLYPLNSSGCYMDHQVLTSKKFHILAHGVLLYILLCLWRVRMDAENAY